MLRIDVHMNSAVEAVLNFKTCCGLQAQDQNLEILVTNEGDEAVSLQPFFDLEGPDGLTRVANLTPAGGLVVPPGEIRAMYCQMDEGLFRSGQRLLLYDRNDRLYLAPLAHDDC